MFPASVGQTVQISNRFTEDFNKLFALHEHIQTVFKKENKLDIMGSHMVNTHTKYADESKYTGNVNRQIKKKCSAKQ